MVRDSEDSIEDQTINTANDGHSKRVIDPLQPGLSTNIWSITNLANQTNCSRTDQYTKYMKDTKESDLQLPYT